MKEPSDIRPGDYVSFTRVILPAEKLRNRGATKDSKLDILVIPRRIIERSGAGLVDAITKGESKIGDESMIVLSVDAGPVLGKVKVPLDETIKVLGEQQSMMIDTRDDQLRAIGMYGTDAKGGA